MTLFDVMLLRHAAPSRSIHACLVDSATDAQNDGEVSQWFPGLWFD